MQQEKSLKAVESPKQSSVVRRKVVLTPEQEAQARKEMEEFDKAFRKKFEGGLDLSGQESR